MVERKLSRSSELEKHYRKIGAVLFIVNNQGEMLLVQENRVHDTDGGQIGNFSVVCETAERGEDWASNVIRGIQEELGPEVLANGHLAVNPDKCFLGESVFGPGVLARVVILHYTGEPNSLIGTSGDGEVVAVGWRKPQELLEYPLRPGVKKILEGCIIDGSFENLISPTNKLVPLSLDSLKATEPLSSTTTSS
ncbi:MAG: NUDIX hydrolase [Candidatus Blackburnbacteria bacterium]|nr:NUDIX hydrolase [Candidatus Blackburnbacteria bacterium]